MYLCKDLRSGKVKKKYVNIQHKVSNRRHLGSFPTKVGPLTKKTVVSKNWVFE